LPERRGAIDYLPATVETHSLGSWWLGRLELLTSNLANWKMGSRKKLSDIKGVRGVLYRAGQLQMRTTFVAGGIANFVRRRIHRNGSRPSITAVIVGRNDDYMADFRERLYATIDWNTRYLIDDVIFVEWNPPPERELLAYGLTEKFKMLRAYVVPPEIHQAINRNPHLQLLEYHAKNVGVRRALTPWILTTNADAALGMNTINRILDTRLDPNVVWTAERTDIRWDENKQHHLSLMASLRYDRFLPYDRLGTGEFALASRHLWERTRGYDESLVKHKIGCDVRGITQMLAHGAQISKAGTVLHLKHPTSCVEGVRPFHGETATLEGVPYQNGDDWGLGTAREEQLADRVWRLTAAGCQ
jgi:hypothetical protein